MIKLFKQRFQAWIARHHPPQRGPIQLERQRVYILPTNYGYTFALMLMVLFLWSANYSNNMGFALTFLLAAVALNTMWRCNNQLLGLQVYPGNAEAVFAGQEARFSFRVDNPEPQTRYGIALQWQHQSPAYVDVPGHGSAIVTLAIPSNRRGLLQLGRIRVQTRFPLGLFQAWSWVEFEQSCLVYPQPQGKRPLPLETASAAGNGVGEWGTGSEDYAGLRNYARGDSPRHVAWKVSVRQGELLVKRFTNQVRFELWLDWRLLAPEAVEARLSQLCQWVLKAERESLDYGLRLPGVELAPARGEGQRRRCLEALALFELDGRPS